MSLRNVLIPSRALFRSVHAGSFEPFENWHMEPVRSSTSMMSRGLTEQGEQAVAVALTVNELTPITFANTVLTTEVDLTLIELTWPFDGVQPVTIACTHFVWTVIAALSFELNAFSSRARGRRSSRSESQRRCPGGRARRQALRRP